MRPHKTWLRPINTTLKMLQELLIAFRFYYIIVERYEYSCYKYTDNGGDRFSMATVKIKMAACK